MQFGHPKRREFVTLLSGAVAWPLAARAQQAGKQWRIGMLETISAAANAANLNALRKGLRDFGYVEGNNFIIEYRSAEGADDRFPDLATELIRRDVDLIITRGTLAAIAAKHATATIPIVMAASGNPVGTGLVASLARPGGNVTGLSAIVIDLQAKRIELLKDMIPSLRRVASMLDMGNPATQPAWKEIEEASHSLGLENHLFDVRKPADIEPAFDSAAAQQVEAIYVNIDPVTLVSRGLIVELAIKRRLPTMYASKEFVETGGLISYGVSYRALYRRAAAYIDKIFKGARPADLPVEQPTQFELVVNLKTARIIGLTFPQSIFLRADEVVE